MKALRSLRARTQSLGATKAFNEVVLLPSVIKPKSSEPIPTLPDLDFLTLDIPKDYMKELDEEIPPEPVIELPPDPKFPESRLPVELWREIFGNAGWSPRKDEFGREGPGYNIMRCDPSSIRAPYNREDMYNAIQTRLSVVQVCKYWNLIGMKVLYSHLVLNLSGRDHVINSLYEKLCVAPDLASSVIRLDAIVPAGRLPSYFYNFEQLLGRLPSLKIITCPLPFGLSPYHCCPDVVLLEKGYTREAKRTKDMDFWRSVRIMRLDCGTDFIKKWPYATLSFPRLEDLSIIEENSTMAKYIIEYWDMPSLRTLSIDSNGLIPGLKVIERSRLLEKLELKLHALILPGEILILPKLRVLYFVRQFARWKDLIEAPRLHRVGIFEIPAWVGNLEDDFERAIELFSSVKEVSLRGEGQTTMNTPGCHWQIDIEKWRLKGITIDVI